MKNSKHKKIYTDETQKFNNEIATEIGRLYNEKISTQIKHNAIQSLQYHAYLNSSAVHTSSNNIKTDNNIDLKFIVVEGDTDYKFFKKFDKINKYYNIVYIIDGNEALKQKKEKHFKSSKQSILDIISGIGPKEILENRIYGIVDRDYGKKYPDAFHSKVFSNDTHDLETMLFNSDEELYSKIGLTNDEWDKIKFMVYQIALVKNAIYEENKIDYIDFNQKLNNDDFDKIFNNKVLDVEKYIELLKSYSNINDDTRLIQLIKKLKRDKKLDSQSRWILDFDKFNQNLPENFWQIVNGHDLINMISYVVGKRKDYSEDIINCYNYNNFKKNTELYKKMLKEKIFG